MLFDPTKCAVCVGQPCVKACGSDALRPSGVVMTTKEIVARLVRNRGFYSSSGGGVTLSGGEPFMQPQFVHSLASECRDLGISIGVETCGYWKWDDVKDTIPLLSFVFFDLKAASSDLHERVTGKGNHLILENLRRLVRALGPDKLTVSIPLIPKVSLAAGEFARLLQLTKEIGVKKVRLLPYHRLGLHKYEQLGRPSQYHGVPTLSQQDVSDLLKEAQKANITVSLYE